MVRIDANVEDTALQVEGGHAEILKYFQVRIWLNYVNLKQSRSAAQSKECLITENIIFVCFRALLPTDG